MLRDPELKKHGEKAESDPQAQPALAIPKQARDPFRAAEPAAAAVHPTKARKP